MEGRVAAGHGVLAQDRDVGAGVEVEAGAPRPSRAPRARRARRRSRGRRAGTGTRRPVACVHARSSAGRSSSPRQAGVARTERRAVEVALGGDDPRRAGGQRRARARRTARPRDPSRSAGQPSGPAAPRRARSSAPASRRLAQQRGEVCGVGLEHPRLADGLEVVDAPSGHRQALRADAPAGLRRAELVGRAAGGVMTGRPLAIASSTGMAKPSPR